MHCIQCGQKLEGTGRFCGHCGAPIEGPRSEGTDA